MFEKKTFLDVCRLCLSKNKVNIFIFDDSIEDKILTKIHSCLPIKVYKGDELPKKICDECFTQLETFVQFRNKCVFSEKTLQTSLEKNQNYLQFPDVEDDKETKHDATTNEQMSQPNNFLDVQIKEEFNSDVIMDALVDPAQNESADTKKRKSRNTKKKKNENTFIDTDKPFLDTEWSSDDNTNEESCSDFERDYGSPLDSSNKKDDEDSTDIENGSQTKSPPKKSRTKQKRGKKKDTTTPDGVVVVNDYCMVCNTYFTSKRGLRRHNLKKHNSIKTDTSVLCDICGKRLSNRDKLRAHRNIHTGHRPHSCSVCAKTFIEREELKKHRRVHTGEKPYLCPYCGKGFTQSTSRRIHERTHTGEKPYICGLCNNGFISKGVMSTHMKRCKGPSN